MACTLNLVRAGEVEALTAYLNRHIVNLANAGAEVAAISAVAPHICAPSLADVSPLPLVDIVTALNEELQSKRLKRIALFGARFAMETALFGRLTDVEVVRSTAGEVDTIHETYMHIASAGRAESEDVASLRRIAQRLCAEEGAQAIVLAGTDLSFVFSEADAGFPALDCTRVHVEAIMTRLRAST
jgi:aspartate racemase